MIFLKTSAMRRISELPEIGLLTKLPKLTITSPLLLNAKVNVKSSGATWVNLLLSRHALENNKNLLIP